MSFYLKELPSPVKFLHICTGKFLIQSPYIFVEKLYTNVHVAAVDTLQTWNKLMCLDVKPGSVS